MAVGAIPAWSRCGPGRTPCAGVTRANANAAQPVAIHPPVEAPAVAPRPQPPISAMYSLRAVAQKNVATSSNRTTGGGSSNAVPAASGDLRLDLWFSLLQATAVQLTAATAAAATAANGVALRLQRLSEPAPMNFPPGPEGDQTLSLLSDPLGFLTSTTAQYGPLVGLLLGGERVVLVTGREAARTVLVEQAGSVYVKEGTAFFPGSSLAGNGLLVSDGPVWQRQRRLSNPAFRRAAVEAYSGAMVAATCDMLDNQWVAGGTRDVYADFNELTLRVTLEALFGFVTTKQQHHDQQRLAASEPPLFASSLKAATGFIIPEWLPTWDNLEFAAAVQQLDRVVYGMIARRREELDAAFDALPSDLLTSLLLSRDDDGTGMSDQALRDELMTLLVAGQETSAILLGWAAALLAAHPEVQARAAAEVASVCGRGVAPTAASVRDMPYLESIVLETLRLYSPAYMVGRCAQVDATLGPYSLPTGTTVLVSPFVMHRDAAVWDQPNVFLPERWQELQTSNLGPNGAYLPFGGGPRNCIGTGFAMMEGMLVLAAVLQRYDLTLPPQTLQQAQHAAVDAAAVAGVLPASFPKPKPLLTLRPESVVLRITPR
ncbi:hypothetical protein VOLCADRAFT_82539 [Volvox carteri f. nagariensis]|uniref:Cytochrome P450 n=1 Tax=Volvox carteri f. nagariensis TaxID=3068 RepID=D8U5J9_VOLCA|nr:uncharacterized protein VOLCADRAFT_82539 [Volvox carteri f. nagariensis]EFJ44932.1 hypothetical protein VOLCADRAFT_82539 [Volvox carteri f. nagariensis]|eukprot:XP_002953903.1 hypothetical protein VOLCADRAFT_82539 [Volvox carteri f. nagariensis]